MDLERRSQATKRNLTKLNNRLIVVLWRTAFQDPRSSCRPQRIKIRYPPPAMTPAERRAVGLAVDSFGSQYAIMLHKHYANDRHVVEVSGAHPIPPRVTCDIRLHRRTIPTYMRHFRKLYAEGFSSNLIIQETCEVSCKLEENPSVSSFLKCLMCVRIVR